MNAVNEQAAALGRAPLDTHGLQVWTGIDNNRRRGRARLAKAMETMYRIPFERFARYSPWGSAEEIAEYLAPYRDARLPVVQHHAGGAGRGAGDRSGRAHQGTAAGLSVWARLEQIADDWRAGTSVTSSICASDVTSPISSRSHA